MGVGIWTLICFLHPVQSRFLPDFDQAELLLPSLLHEGLQLLGETTLLHQPPRFMSEEQIEEIEERYWRGETLTEDED